MKKILCIFMLLWMAFSSVHAASVNKKSDLEIAQDLYDDVTQDRALTIPEINEILERLGQFSLNKHDKKTEKMATLLKVKVLTNKYNVLEAPDWKNNKGGLAYLREARNIIDSFLKVNPNDLEFLFALVDSQLRLKENPRLTINKMISKNPESGWVRFLSVVNYLKSKDYKNAIHEIILTIKNEHNSTNIISFMEKGIVIADEAGCPFKDELTKIFDKVPKELQGDLAEAEKTKRELNSQVASLEKVKSEYLKMYESADCSKSGK